MNLTAFSCILAQTACIKEFKTHSPDRHFEHNTGITEPAMFMDSNLLPWRHGKQKYFRIKHGRKIVVKLWSVFSVKCPIQKKKQRQIISLSLSF